MKHASEGSRESAAIQAAIDLIAAVPGYAETAETLRSLLKSGHLRFDPHLSDRGITDWQGRITIGPEPLSEGIVGLAETLVHEQFHRTQPVYIKTVSFWGGVVTGTPVWRRLEQPAYQAAYRFLSDLAMYANGIGREDIATQAEQERNMVAHSFQSFFHVPLFA